MDFLAMAPMWKNKFKRLGGSGSPDDFINWQMLEDKNPLLFLGMYQFFAQYNPE